jgi:hypothetical protein
MTSTPGQAVEKKHFETKKKNFLSSKRKKENLPLSHHNGFNNERTTQAGIFGKFSCQIQFKNLLTLACD